MRKFKKYKLVTTANNVEVITSYDLLKYVRDYEDVFGPSVVCIVLMVKLFFIAWMSCRLIKGVGDMLKYSPL